MQFIKANYYTTDLPAVFDGVITDVPYIGSLSGQLGEEYFDPIQFMERTYLQTKTDSFLITFSHFLGMTALVSTARVIGWKFVTFQIWNKFTAGGGNLDDPRPRRHCEYILFFTKGNYQFPSFDTVFLKYYVNSFTKAKVSEKPTEFSEWFKSLVGDVYILDPHCGTGNLISTFTNAIGVDIKNYPGLKMLMKIEYEKFKAANIQLKNQGIKPRKDWAKIRQAIIDSFEKTEPNPLKTQEIINKPKSAVKTLKQSSMKLKQNSAAGSIYQFVKTGSPRPGLVTGVFIEKDTGEIIPMEGGTVRTASERELKATSVTTIKGKAAQEFFKAKGLVHDPATGGFKPMQKLGKTESQVSKIELLKIQLPRMWTDYWKRANVLQYGREAASARSIPHMPEDWDRGYLDTELSAEENLGILLGIAAGSERKDRPNWAKAGIEQVTIGSGIGEYTIEQFQTNTDTWFKVNMPLGGSMTFKNLGEAVVFIRKDQAYSHRFKDITVFMADGSVKTFKGYNKKPKKHANKKKR